MKANLYSQCLALFCPLSPLQANPFFQRFPPPENQKFCDVFKGVEKEKIGLK